MLSVIFRKSAMSGQADAAGSLIAVPGAGIG